MEITPTIGTFPGAPQGQPPVRVSLVIHTFNEESNIVDCIKSVGNFANEILVCDMYSEDRTSELAKSQGARVVFHAKEPIAERARRFAIEQARGEWILLLDADERATPALLDELGTLLKRESTNVVLARWRFLFMGKLLAHTSMARVTKPFLFRRNSFLAVAPRDENVTMYPDPFEGLHNLKGVVVAREPFIHYGYQTLTKYVRKTFWYYSIRDAEWRFTAGATPNLKELVMLPVYRFIRSYFFHQGFRDGIEGFIMSAVWAIYGFLVTAHLYDLKADRREDLGGDFSRG